MVWKKGESGNPAGLTVLQARTRRMIEGLGPKAVLRLEGMLASENESVALGAAKEILSRVAPAPKNGTMSLEVTHNASPHLAALVGMAAQTMARVSGVPENGTQVIDVTDYHPKPTGSDSMNVALVAPESDERGDE